MTQGRSVADRLARPAALTTHGSLSARERVARKNKKRAHKAPWLILPVVICLSQRLSHACLSACRIKVKPRMAH